MSNDNLVDSGINLPVLCPECGAECEYISTGKHGNVLTKEPSRFVAFFGCKPCYAVIVADCEQVWGAFEWAEMIEAHKDDGRIHNPFDDYFGVREFDGDPDDDDGDPDDDYHPDWNEPYVLPSNDLGVCPACGSGLENWGAVSYGDGDMCDEIGCPNCQEQIRLDNCVYSEDEFDEGKFE